MCAKKKDTSEPEHDDSDTSEPVDDFPETDMDVKSLEDFVSDYLTSYRDYLSNMKMDERHLPQFYKGFPFTVEIYSLPNNTLCALFKKANRSKYMVMDGDFEEVLTKTKNKSYDFLQAFPPFTRYDSDEAERLARVDADRDLKASRRLELLGAAEAHINDIHEDVNSMVELNPWLDQQSEEQRQKLEKAKELINELYAEIDIDKDERFSDYSRQITELMVFEKADLENVAGELEIRLEEAIEEMNDRIFAIEESFDSHEHDNMGAPVELQDELADLTKTVREMNLKIKDLSGAGSGMNEELADELAKVQRQLNDAKKNISELQKELKKVQADAAVSKEIKDTVFRDSKRAHNLNERTNDLEKEIKELKKTAGKGGSAAEVKALEGKLNVLEKKLKDYAKDYTDKKVKREIDKLPKPPEVTTTTETTPMGDGTVKRTTKKTTKTTTKKKK